MCHITTDYPRLRAGLAPEFLEVPDEGIEQLVTRIYGENVAAEDVEAFWDDVGRGFKSVAQGASHFVQQAAPVVGRALPGIAQGASAGMALGPWGALAGAVAGGAGGILSQSKDPTLRGIGGAIGGVTQLAGNFTGGGALGKVAGALGGGGGGLGQLAGMLGGGRGGGAGGIANIAGSLVPQLAGALGGGRGGAAGGIANIAGSVVPQLAGVLGGAQGGSANALLGMLARPETMQALSAAALGPYGRAQVPVGQHNVSVQSILGALGTLAGHAAEQSEAVGGHPSYFYGESGELAIDPADAAARTGALLELFVATPSPWLHEAAEAHDERDPGEYSARDAAYDAWLRETEGAEAEYAGV